MTQHTLRLSRKSRALIREGLAVYPSLLNGYQKHRTLSLDDVDTLLHVDSLQYPKQSHVISRLQNELLHNLYLTVKKKNGKSSTKPPTKPTSLIKVYGKKALFAFLLLCGVVCYGCEGFDSITSILGIFSLPAAVVLTAGLLFSLLSIVVFCGFELLEISKNLNVSVRYMPGILDAKITELKEISRLKRELNEAMVNADHKELKDIIQMAELLAYRCDLLKKAGNAFKHRVNHPILTAIRGFLSLSACLMFFGGGYFAGQTVAIALVGLISAAAGPAFWPVIGLSVLVGLCALSVYWFVERPAVSNLVSQAVGLNPDDIERLSDDKEVRKLNEELIVIKKLATRQMCYEQTLPHGQTLRKRCMMNNNEPNVERTAYAKH